MPALLSTRQIPGLPESVFKTVWMLLVGLTLIGVTIPVGATGMDSEQEWRSWTEDGYSSDRMIGRIWSRKDQAFVAPSRLLNDVAKARFVLLGENHDNIIHHQLRAWIIENADFDAPISVVMEQIDASKSDLLRAFLQQPDPDAAKLGDALNWSTSGWPEWSFYLPIAAAAIDRQAAIVPGLPTREETRRIGGEGLEALSSDRLSELHLDRALQAEDQQALHEEIVVAHCELLPEQAVPAMIAVQRFRDAFMAEAMRKAGENGASILIAGNGHAHGGYGVPWYLRKAGETEILVVTLTELVDETSKIHDAIDEDVEADYVWFTSSVDRGDPCESIRKRFGKG